ncbi:phosphatase PAP2 family protein [Streptomyces sp. NPDC006784]|uniref:phosphatase PAP2 family protein n=1 Tax=Streptomyces sp. NPDC006784 TaxID=3364764 RepID=UPI0036865754
MSACGLCALLLLLGTWQVLVEGALVRRDEELGAAVRRMAPPEMPAEALSDLGNLEVALPLLAVAMTLSLLRPGGRRWWPVACYGAAVVLMVPLVLGLKVWTDRAGPSGGAGFYPSGHAATTAAVLGGALLLLSGGLSRIARRAARALVVILVVGNGLGLVWRGYHWPLDVLAGWCLSVLLLCAAFAAARHRGPGDRLPRTDRIRPHDGRMPADPDPPRTRRTPSAGS